MGALQVLFEVPTFIQVGLETGAFQRVGGVIVDASSKQVVAWLRDGNALEEVANKALNSIFSVTQMALTGQVINLAMTAMTLRIITQRLDKLSAEVEKLGKEIVAQFQHDRDLKFKASLEEARDALETTNVATRHNAVTGAVRELHIARENFFKDFLISVEKGSNNPKFLPLAEQQLLRAIYATISRIQCYLVTDDTELAKKRLNEDLQVIRKHTETLVMAWLGKYPALYFHQKIPAKDLERFFRILAWKHNTDITYASTLVAIINDYRNDFWNEAIDLNKKPNIADSVVGTFLGRNQEDTRYSNMLHGLQQCEILLENFGRLEGFELELRSMRLAVEDWNALVDEKTLKEHGGAIIIDDEIAEKYTRLQG
jgi:hypothetical protein